MSSGGGSAGEVGGLEDEGEGGAEGHCGVGLDAAEFVDGLAGGGAAHGDYIVERFAGVEDEGVGIACGLDALAHLAGVKHLLEAAHDDVVTLRVFARCAAVFGIADDFGDDGEGVVAHNEVRGASLLAEAVVDRAFDAVGGVALCKGAFVGGFVGRFVGFA